MAYKTLSEKELSKLELSIIRGDSNAEYTMRKELKRIAKAANTRLLRLEKAGYENSSSAYGRAVGYLQEFFEGATRYRTGKYLKIDDVFDLYREAKSFMAKETSTIRGVKYAQSRLLDTVETLGYTVPREDLDKFYEFLQSDTVYDVMQNIDISEIVIDAISNGFFNLKKSIDEIMDNFEKYLNGEIQYYDELLERVGGIRVADLYKRQNDRRRVRSSASKGSSRRFRK